MTRKIDKLAILDGRDNRVTAVLGPTNTGKTHLAIDRMIGYKSGMIGLPLRLLAREVYGRVAEQAGKDTVALVTGEEKIVPKSPKYWVSTVEAMPLDVEVEFVAVDEVQMAADLERGHIFTHRIQFVRGVHETLLLGSETIRPLLEQLVPELNVVSRPRMSILSYSGSKKITRLPPRSAAVTFSSEDVYSIAELVRRQRGGAAVVLGSLSPRTRNAQVEMFQSGEVDILVATDAIGMGLNLNVSHVAFAGMRKFDGQNFRDLSPAEIGQIAGRAGRHMQDGTFGVTGRVDPLSQELVDLIESHQFRPLNVLQWRNSNLDFSNLQSLYDSLNMPPNEPGLTRIPYTHDIQSLELLSKDENIIELANDNASVRLLWDVCQLPDYRKIAPSSHAELIGTIFTFLSRQGNVPEDWLAKQVSYANRTDGDIDTLTTRIAHIRTWTYLANRSDWLINRNHWQEQTRAIENRLSDALHDQLILRFVDRRTSILQMRLRENTVFGAEVTSNGEIFVDDQQIGHLNGFQFVSNETRNFRDEKAFRTIAMKALTNEFELRAERFGKSSDKDIVLTQDGIVSWLDQPIAKLIKGDSALVPGHILIADDQLMGPAREIVQKRIGSWIKDYFETVLKPLFNLAGENELDGLAKGMAFRLVESFGIIERRSISEEVRQLEQTHRGPLRRLGVRFGPYHVYLPALLKPAPIQLLAILWTLKNDGNYHEELTEIPKFAATGRTTIPANPKLDPGIYRILGFHVCGSDAVRIDILERLAELIRPLVSWKADPTISIPPEGTIEGGGGFTVTLAMKSLLGCSGETISSILISLGYRLEKRKVPASSDSKPDHLETKKHGKINGNQENAAKKLGTAISESTNLEMQNLMEIWRPYRPKPRYGSKKNKPQKKSHATTSMLPNDGNNDFTKKKRRNGKFKNNSKQTEYVPNSPFAELAILKEQLTKANENQS